VWTSKGEFSVRVPPRAQHPSHRHARSIRVTATRAASESPPRAQHPSHRHARSIRVTATRATSESPPRAQHPNHRHARSIRLTATRAASESPPRAQHPRATFHALRLFPSLSLYLRARAGLDTGDVSNVQLPSAIECQGDRLAGLHVGQMLALAADIHKRLNESHTLLRDFSLQWTRL
jgi:hypothetical protein